MCTPAASRSPLRALCAASTSVRSHSLVPTPPPARGLTLPIADCDEHAAHPDHEGHLYHWTPTQPNHPNTQEHGTKPHDRYHPALPRRRRTPAPTIALCRKPVAIVVVHTLHRQCDLTSRVERPTGAPTSEASAYSPRA